MLYPSLPVLPQEIETQTVLFLIDLVEEALPQDSPLSRVEQTLEDGILHPLTAALAYLGHSPQPLLTLQCLCTNVVGNHHQHLASSLAYLQLLRYNTFLPLPSSLESERKPYRHM